MERTIAIKGFCPQIIRVFIAIVRSPYHNRILIQAQVFEGRSNATNTSVVVCHQGAVNLLTTSQAFHFIIAQKVRDTHASRAPPMGYCTGKIDEKWLFFILLHKLDDFVSIKVFNKSSFIYADNATRALNFVKNSSMKSFFCIFRQINLLTILPDVVGIEVPDVHMS